MNTSFSNIWLFFKYFIFFCWLVLYHYLCFSSAFLHSLNLDILIYEFVISFSWYFLLYYILYIFFLLKIIELSDIYLKLGIFSIYLPVWSYYIFLNLFILIFLLILYFYLIYFIKHEIIIYYTPIFPTIHIPNWFLTDFFYF